MIHLITLSQREIQGGSQEGEGPTTWQQAREKLARKKFSEEKGIAEEIATSEISGF